MREVDTQFVNKKIKMICKESDLRMRESEFYSNFPLAADSSVNQPLEECSEDELEVPEETLPSQDLYQNL